MSYTLTHIYVRVKFMSDCNKFAVRMIKYILALISSVLIRECLQDAVSSSWRVETTLLDLTLHFPGTKT